MSKSDLRSGQAPGRAVSPAANTPGSASGNPSGLQAHLRQRPWLITVAFVLTCLALWELAAARPGRPEYLLGPWRILNEVLALAEGGGLAAQVLASLRRALLGFAIGGGLGLLLGLLAGVSRNFRDLFDLTQAFTHPVPKIALFPVVAVVLGFTDVSRVLIIAISAFFPAYLNAVNGALGVNPRLLWVARNVGASRWRTFWQVLLPASLPRAVVGLRISLMVSFVLMVATEVVGHSNGLGAALMRAYREGAYGPMYAGIVCTALCGMAANALLGQASRRLLAWQAHAGGHHG
ncbi:MAG: ABC transporter permease subunit [Ramlibacter sp.]|nr:ABC transporter permease subunit [Ramlibacter sp.]